MNDNEPAVVRPFKTRRKGFGDARSHFLINPMDQAAACRARAAADIEQAATLSTANARRVLESSAASWTVRAELLDRLEASFNARQARKAEGEEGAAD